MSIYTGHTTDSGASKNEDDLIYKSLTFEDELFTARVYKRNYRTPALRRLFKRTEQKTSDKTRACTMAQENVEDPNHSEAERCTIREPRPARWQHTKAQNAGPSISFADACEQGDAEIVRIFLQSGQDVHVPILGRFHSFLDLSAIHVAAKGGHVQVVEILLSYGADREMLSQCSLIRPLHLAVQAGHIVMVRYLLDNGTNIAAPDGNSAQAIHKAAECGSTAILSFLLDRGAAIDSATTNGCQPLHTASQNPERANVIRFLCSQGADIEAKTRLGDTPLYYAWLYNRLDNAEVLLECGAVHGEQVPLILSTAIGHGHLQATRLLLERGVDPNHPVYGQRTALHGLFNDYTVLYFDRYHSPQSAEIVELLLEYGADVDLQDWNGDTPLHCLCRRSLHQNEYPEMHMVNILLRSMRDIDTINFDGKTALCLSIQSVIGNDITQSLVDCSTRLLLSQLLIGSGARLLLSKPGIEIGLTLDESSNEHLFILDFYLRRGSNTLTQRIGKYEKDDSIVGLDNLSIDVLRRLLRDPESSMTALTSLPHYERTSVPSISSEEAFFLRSHFTKTKGINELCLSQLHETLQQNEENKQGG